MKNMLKSKDFEDKARGALYGFAIGDAMGATTEFMDADDIRKQYGRVEDIIGGGWLGLKPGQVTDDTQMMICVMDALEKNVKHGNGNGSFLHFAGDNFVKWYESGPKDIGSQCSKGIAYYKRYGKVRVAKPTELGNGGLMRAVPCAIWDDPYLNEVQNSVTHNNDKCRLYLNWYSLALKNCFDHDWPYAKLGKREEKLLDPTGCITNTYNNAMVYATNSVSFASAIIWAVNDGGDADTIGALTGALAGAMYGYRAIPEKWLDVLDPEVKKYFEKFLNFLLQYQ